MTKKLSFLQIKRGILSAVWSKQGLYELTFPYPSMKEAQSHLTTKALMSADLDSQQQQWQQSLLAELEEYFSGMPTTLRCRLIGRTIRSFVRRPCNLPLPFLPGRWRLMAGSRRRWDDRGPRGQWGARCMQTERPSWFRATGSWVRTAASPVLAAAWN